MAVPTDRQSDTDLALADLLDELTRGLRAGEPLDLEAYASRHPDQAEQLRELLPALEFLADAAEVGVHSGPGGGLDDRSAAEIAPPPPRGMLGDFRIVREIGRGGMGIVYEAEQVSLGRRVALKVFPFAAVLDPRRLQRFKNEAQAAASLDHPNIVSVHFVGCERGVHYYAMQYIEGQTLAEVIQQGRGERDEGRGERDEGRGTRDEGRGERDEGPDASPSIINHQSSILPPHPVTPSPPHAVETSPLAAFSTEGSTRDPEFFRTVARLGIQAAEALEHAHGLGVVHRDIKPSNVMVDARGHLWITDFGLAMTQTDANLTMTGDVLGTLRYMSPEQLQAEHGVLDHRTDVYSLGLTLYELITLQPAFPGDDRQKLIRRIAEDEPPRPRQLNHEIPKDLETIVLKATAKEPHSRYATAAELAEDLRRFVEGRPIQARRPSAVERGAKWLRRHPSAVLSAVLLLAVAVIGLTVGVAWVTHEQGKTAAALKEKEAALSMSEANVRLAAEAVEQMLTRSSQDAVFHGHVEHAEMLMADAVALFRQLLRRSRDPELRYRAAQAYNTAGEIQRLLGRYEESRDTHQQAVAILSELADDFRDQPAYQSELASSHNYLGMALYYLFRAQEAERSLKDAVAIRERLAARFPDRPKFQMDMADSLGNLGQVYREMDRLDEAERTCRRVLSILDGLPRECRLGPEGLSRLGAATGNLALVLRDRGKLDDAEALLEKAYWCHVVADGRLPDNPTYRNGLYNACWNCADLYLRQGNHAKAASQVEEMVKSFPDRLQAYSEGVALLVRCAELAAEDPAEADKAEAYNRRAGELLKQSSQAVDRPAYSANELAWFLATWPEEGFRDIPRAVALAQGAAEAMPENANHWNTLGVARYRAGNWKAAVEGLKKSMELSAGGSLIDWLPMAMAQHRLGNHQEAHRWYDKAVKWMEKNKPEDRQLGRFRNEAAKLLEATEGKGE